jgi:tetratricopeptide (TPR) repeat protein
MPGRGSRRAWPAVVGGLLLAGLMACAGSPEPQEQEPQEQEPQEQEPQEQGQAQEQQQGQEPPQTELSVTAPAAQAGGQAAVPAAELPEPRAESPEVTAGAVGPSGMEPETASSGQAAAGGPTVLPVPRPPAESAKAPAEKTPGARQPAKSAKSAPAPTAAPAKPGPAVGAASKKSAEKGPREREPREVLARKGDTVVIDLEGRGWLLLPGDRRGVSFLGSETGPQRTSFSFKAQELGDFELGFQLQDNARGAATGEVVRLRVLPEEKFREMLAPQKADLAVPAAAREAPESADPARLEKAERLFAGGFFDLALPEYLAIYREGDPQLNDRLAAIYLEKGEPAAAAKFYDRNLSAAAPYGRLAVVGLVRAGLAMASPELVLQHLPALLELPPAETRAELLDVARFAASQGSYPQAMELLTEYLRRHPRGVGLDEAYFQLARLYDLESPMRDVRLARDYYRRVYEDFPESEHAAEAHNRILYLDRHFFHVQ